MPGTSHPYYDSEEVRRFQTLLEEVTRAKPGTPAARFVNPDDSVTSRLESNFHHVLFGRRGSGKTSLLRHIQSTNQAGGRLVAWVDYEIFMNLSFPDVLVSTLETIFKDFEAQLRSRGVQLLPESELKPHWWTRRRSRTSQEALVWDIHDVASQLTQLKHSPDSSAIDWKVVQSDSTSRSLSMGTALTGGHGAARASASASRRTDESISSEHTLSSSYSARKDEHLERALPAYRALIQRITHSDPNAFVLLDELYRLNSDDQPRVLGYLHRAIKDTGTWLKVGTLRYATRLYKAGPPATGLQAPHDIRELSLDRGLLDFHNSKRFLEEILRALAKEVGVDVERLFSLGALDRLVLSSGGVPRDYIGILSESIAVARNRGPSQKLGSERVIAEDVNEAAGRTVEAKFNDLDELAGEHRDELRDLVFSLTAHCRRSGAAWFLVDIADVDLHRQVDELQNMRFVHLLDSNESLPTVDSSRYTVLLLDVSQLAAQRALQLDFTGWTKREKRRSGRLVFRGEVGAAPAEEQAVVVDAGSPSLPGDAASDAAAVIGKVDPSVQGLGDS